MIFYFSATGNSLYIARELDENAISIPHALKGDLKFSDEMIGIVCPDFGSEMPDMVKEFLEKGEFNTPYFFIIMSYGCNKGEAVNLTLRECKKANIKLDYFKSILMVDNFLPAFDMKKEKSIDKHIKDQLAIIKSDIEKRQHFIEETSEEEKAVYSGYQKMIAEHPEYGWRMMEFSLNDSCIGCATCQKVCPAGAIRMENNRPVHTYVNCQRCLSCVHICPKKAISIKGGEVNANERFINENVTPSDIIAANRSC